MAIGAESSSTYGANGPPPPPPRQSHHHTPKRIVSHTPKRIVSTSVLLNSNKELAKIAGMENTIAKQCSARSETSVESCTDDSLRVGSPLRVVSSRGILLKNAAHMLTRAKDRTSIQTHWPARLKRFQVAHGETSRLAVAFAGALLRLAVFFAAGCAVYMPIEGWGVLQTVYFAVASMSTVGYGDLAPTNAWARAFTIFYVIVGIIAVFSHVSSFLFRFSKPFFAWTRNHLESVFPPEYVEIDDELHGVPRRPAVFFTKSLAAPLFLYTVIQLGFAGLFVLIEQGAPYTEAILTLADGTVLPLAGAAAGAVNGTIGAVTRYAADWTYDASIYHCFVTSTTVGYGDTSVRTDAGMLLAIFHVMLSVTYLAAVINDIGNLRKERRAKMRRLGLLMRRLDANLLDDFDLDGDGIDKLEFVVGMMVKLGLVRWEDARPFMLQFDALDADGSGMLTKDDMQTMRAQMLERRALLAGDDAISKILEHTEREESPKTGRQLASLSEPGRRQPPNAAPRRSHSFSAAALVVGLAGGGGRRVQTVGGRRVHITRIDRELYAEDRRVEAAMGIAATVLQARWRGQLARQTTSLRQSSAMSVDELVAQGFGADNRDSSTQLQLPGIEGSFL